MRALALLLLAGATPLAGQQRRAPPKHYTYVFVHGACGGGWDWRAVDSDHLPERTHTAELVRLLERVP